MTKFIFRSLRVFLTYSQAHTDVTLDWKIELSDHLIHLGFNQGVVCREAHQDGNFHYHCYGVSTEQVYTSDCRYFDYLGIHPNVQRPRSIRSCINYVNKGSDTYDFGGFDSQAQVMAVNTKRSVIACKLIASDCVVTAELLDEHPELVFGLKRLREDLESVREVKRLACRPPPILTMNLGDVTWCFSSTVRSKVLYLFGQPGVGKSTYLDVLDQDAIYYAPSNDDWKGLDASYHRMIVFEEFDSYVKLGTMNRILEGRPVRLNTKGGSYFLDRNIPKVIISNKRASEQYHNCNQVMRHAFLDRILEVEVKMWQKIDQGDQERITRVQAEQLERDLRLLPTLLTPPLQSPVEEL